MKLTDVSKTAIATLRSHVIKSERRNPVFNDPMAKICLERLSALVIEANDQKIFHHKLSRALTSHIALRARKYDAIINAYILQNPGCTVINLGCGFDTRFWRIETDRCIYIELDLPEVIAIKKMAMGDLLTYELIDCSILDPAWIEQVTQQNHQHFLLVAEGLLMYLPRDETIQLLKRFSTSFFDSQMVCEVVTDEYTRGIWKKIVEMKIKAELGLDAGSSYNFGLRHSQDIEEFSPGLKIINEWSYIDEEDIYPHFLKYFNISRTQWTITASINRRLT